jgi:superfamily I DNA/RNA helicase
LGERLEVHDLNAIGRRLYELNIARTEIADTVTLNKSLQQASENVAGHKFSEHFLRAEWDQVVDAWQLKDWESYRDVKRLGRKTRLPEKQRILLWSLFDWVHKDLKTKNRVTYSEMFSQLADKLSISGKPSFDFVVVDESQDIQVAQLRYLATLGKNRPDSLFFAGDLGQRIFQSPFSWKGLGVDIRGRSTTLKVNYRTTHQIRTYADRLLGPEVSDVDGIGEQRKGTVSVFNGPNPDIRVFASPQAEIMAVSQWLRERALEGYKAHEIGVFVRSEAELERAQEAVGTSGYQFRVLDTHLDILNGHVSIGTMHMAKGLEFRAVAVMACDDEVVPLQSRIETVTDDTDLLEVYETERHLLYVACTRARDQLLVTSGGDPSEFLADMQCYPAKS